MTKARLRQPVETSRRIADRCTAIAGSAVGALFLLSALLKALTPGFALVSIAHLLRSARVFRADQPGSPAFSLLVLSFVLTVEVVLGFLLLIGWRRRLMLRAALATLLVFSAALVALALDPQAPACGCAGAVRLAETAHAENLLSLGRNAILIAATLWLSAPAGRGIIHRD